MRAVVCKEYGPPESLIVRNVDNLEPGDGQVRIAVEACGVNFPDTLIIENKYQIKPPLPFIPGSEVAGIVDAVGDSVSRFGIGDEVMAMAQSGGYAEQLVVDEAAVQRRPKSMSGDIAAAFGMAYGTSMHALKQRAHLQAGETLLVLGAGGGVGLAAVEIANLMGATVIAAASSEEKLAAASDAGAEHLINYSKQDLRGRIREITGKKGVDVFYDPVGGDFFEPALRSTAWNGRALVVGFASGSIPNVPINLALLKGCAIVGVFWGAFRTNEPNVDAENFEQLFNWYEEGLLRPRISQRYPLTKFAEALNALKNRQAVGKIILLTGEE